MPIDWMNPPVANPRDVAVLGGFGNSHRPNSQYGPGTFWGPESLPALFGRIQQEVAAGQPQAFGNMPMQDAQSMNWQQSRNGQVPPDVAAMIDADAQRQAGQQAYAAQPFADSFLRRFGGPMLEQPQQQAQQQLDPRTVAALFGHMGSDMQDAGATQRPMDGADARTLAQNGFPTGSIQGREMVQMPSGQSLAEQPWLDEYASLARDGQQVPMIRGNATTESPEMSQRRQAYGDAKRAERNAGTLPMAERRANVRNNAIYENEQRQVRMGDMSPSQQGFNEVGRFAEGMGDGGDNFLNAYMFGPAYGAQMQEIEQRGQQAQATRDWASSPRGMMASSAANGTPLSMQQIQQLMGGAPTAEMLLQQSGGDWERFKTMANASGMDGQQTLDAWARMTGQQRGGPNPPGILEMIGGAMTPSNWDWNAYD